jgi:K+-transporting ATPase ATPase C chain
MSSFAPRKDACFRGAKDDYPRHSVLKRNPLIQKPMKTHIRSNLLLLGFTVLLCCVLYPLVLFAVGWTVFPSASRGSLITKKSADGQDIIQGSHLIAQPFTDDAYFWSRPSAVSYNATASGASNFGASNPKLRDRVAQQLGPMVVYKSGSASEGPDKNSPRTPQQDIETWFSAKPRVAEWASEFQTAASNWAKTDFADDKYGLPGQFIEAWKKDHKEVVDEWRKDNPGKTDEPKPEDLVTYFFQSFPKIHPGKWPGVVEQPDKSKRIEPVTSDSAISANFFEMWLRDPANKEKAADLEPVVADMVMASASGLDPHITLRNALSVYQLDRVAKKRTPQGKNVSVIRDEIAGVARKMSFTPLSGLVGEPLVNVLDLNREIDEKFPVPPAKAP